VAVSNHEARLLPHRSRRAGALLWMRGLKLLVTMNCSDTPTPADILAFWREAGRDRWY